MFPLLLVGGLAVVGLFLLFRAALSAPEAAEDEHGFHLASQKEASTQPPVFVDTADLAFFRR